MFKQIEEIKNFYKSSLSEEDALSIYNALTSFRHLSSEFSSDSQKVLKDLFEMESESQFCYYPLDILEFRFCLRLDSIPGKRDVLFSYKFARKYGKVYPLLLGIDKSKINGETLNGITISKTGIKLSDCLKRVYVSPKLDKSIFNNIVFIAKDEEFNIDFILDIEVPAIDPKIASKYKKYIVNISQIGIKNMVVRGRNERDAVINAINKVWQVVKSQYNGIRPYQYSPQQWLKFDQTPFWSQIVRDRNQSFNKKAQVDNSVQLNPIEQKIFNFLKAAKQNIPELRDVEFRVAGGWIRDKLMNKESDDIDIAVSKFSGIELVRLLESFAKRNNIEGIGRAHEVSLEKTNEPTEKNPGLMVGAIPIFGQKVEFVPMRTEVYSQESRQPIIQRTDDVKADAKRRDLTINDLYYNIDTGEVEDPTGMGLSDLKNKILRTPLDPVKTFSEDPLRMLRLLRFSSRYPDFTIPKNVLDSLNNPELHEAYIKKVSTERAGKEILKMLAGYDPVKAVESLFKSGLYKAVFQTDLMKKVVPEGVQMDQRTMYHRYNLMDHTLQVMSQIDSKMRERGEPDEMRALMNLVALFHDFGKMYEGLAQPITNDPSREGQMRYLGHEDRSAEMADEIMKSMDIGSSKRKLVTTLISQHMIPHKNKGEDWPKKSIRKALKRLQIEGFEDTPENIEGKGKELIDFHKNLYKYLFLFSEADSMASSPNLEKRQQDIERKRQHLKQFEDFVNQPQPTTSIHKPLLDGHKLMELFPELKPNTGFINYISEILLDLAAEGKISTEEEAITELQKERDNIIQKFSKHLKKIKLADASSGENAMDSSGFTAADMEAPLNRERGEYHLNRILDSYFSVGQQVKLRQVGWGFEQIVGKIENIKDNEITVKWTTGKNRKGRRERFDLNKAMITLDII